MEAPRNKAMKTLEDEAEVASHDLFSPWLLIESAPTDGTHILAYCPEKGVRETHMKQYPKGSAGYSQGLRITGHWDWLEPVSNWSHRWQPTHWMPLPSPPNNE